MLILQIRVPQNIFLRATENKKVDAKNTLNIGLLVMLGLGGAKPVMDILYPSYP